MSCWPHASGATTSSRARLEHDVPGVVEVWNRLHGDLAERSISPAVVHGDVCPPNAYISQGPRGPVVTGIGDFSPHTISADPLLDVAGALIFLELEPYADAPADAAWLEAVAVERHGRDIVRWIDVTVATTASISLTRMPSTRPCTPGACGS